MITFLSSERRNIMEGQIDKVSYRTVVQWSQTLKERWARGVFKRKKNSNLS